VSLPSLQSVPHLDALRAAAAQLRAPLYLVGGAVRDLLLDRPLGDLDLTTTDARDLARAVASELVGVVVPLHDDPVTVRVVASVATGARELDIVQLTGEVGTDLARRDFTINAAALRLWPEPPELLDPHGAAAAAWARRLAVVTEAALDDDPLRLIRAYRLAAQCGLTIESATRGAIAARAPLITQPAAERMAAELVKLLAAPTGAHHLCLMAEDGVLQELLPELAAGAGMDQGGYHHLDVWGHSLQVAAEAERIANHPGEWFPRHAAELSDYVADADRLAAVKLGALLHDVGKPECRVWHEDRFRFFGHDEAGAALALRISRRLRLPGRVGDTTALLVGGHMRPLQLWRTAASDGPSLRAVRRLFGDLGPHVLGLLIVVLADRAGCLGPASDPTELPGLARAFDALLLLRAEVAPVPRRRLLTGRDLIREFGLTPGPRFRELLEATEEAADLGEISTREEALQLVGRLLRLPHPPTEGEPS